MPPPSHRRRKVSEIGAHERLLADMLIEGLAPFDDFFRYRLGRTNEPCAGEHY